MSITVTTSCTDALSRSLKELRTKEIIIKINMVSTHNELAMTPKDCLINLIEFIREKLSYDGRIIIAEGPAIGRAYDGFKKLGLLELRDKYNIDLLDIHEDEAVYVPLFDSNFDTFELPVSKTILNAPYLISICRAKTHDTVITTLSIKNVAVGGIVDKRNRPRIHQGYRAINVNIAILGGIMYPDLGVIDGRLAMEGNGPVNGIAKEWGYVFIGHNPLELDSFVSYCMGFDPDKIGYLYYLGKLGFGDINIHKSIYKKESCIRTHFKPHYTYEKQLNWKISSIEEENQIINEVKKIINKYGRKSVLAKNKFP